MRVDFYQLGDQRVDRTAALLASKWLAAGERLVLVADEPAELSRLDRMLWDQGATSFLPHGIAGSGDDAAQPVLLSTGLDAPNAARGLMIADGQWRDGALAFDRVFYLFGEAALDGARLAWKLLAGRDGVERHYWAREDGRWINKASDRGG
jgi:DNA polymerase-3 subunit chi